MHLNSTIYANRTERRSMSSSLRGADIVARSLKRLGCGRVFTLSGNHIMSIYDAAIEAGLDLVHVRHEAAAVHMADAHGRLSGEPGIALVTGGPGHANAVGALFTALGAESPMVLLSGHAATWELGRGGFQELQQAEMAAPVTKASWMAKSTATLGEDIAEAIRIATSGRPGPVHVSLPSDLLDAKIDEGAVDWPEREAHRHRSRSNASRSRPQGERRRACDRLHRRSEARGAGADPARQEEYLVLAQRGARSARQPPGGMEQRRRADAEAAASGRSVP